MLVCMTTKLSNGLYLKDLIIGMLREMLNASQPKQEFAMSHSIPLSFTLCLLLSPLCMADQVVREVPDTTAGKGYGALTGLMVGAVGGPIGALVGAGAGFFAGSAVQASAGLSETAYEVKDAQGEISTVRSPNARFEPGQQVTRKGPRLVPQDS